MARQQGADARHELRLFGYSGCTSQRMLRAWSSGACRTRLTSASASSPVFGSIAMHDLEARAEQSIAENGEQIIIRTRRRRSQHRFSHERILVAAHRRIPPCDRDISRAKRAADPAKSLRLETGVGAVGRERVIQ